MARQTTSPSIGTAESAGSAGTAETAGSAGTAGTAEVEREDAGQQVDQLVDDLLAELPPASTPPEVFLGTQFDRGLAWVHYPAGRGGLDLAPVLHHRVLARLREAGAPSAALRNALGYGMVAPTLLTHGTPAQLD
ncbi:MAG: hypothetical protein ACRDXC_07000, partial [Acidimicrobiales bacterium]